MGFVLKCPMPNRQKNLFKQMLFWVLIGSFFFSFEASLAAEFIIKQRGLYAELMEANKALDSVKEAVPGQEPLNVLEDNYRSVLIRYVDSVTIYSPVVEDIFFENLFKGEPGEFKLGVLMSLGLELNSFNPKRKDSMACLAASRLRYSKEPFLRSKKLVEQFYRYGVHFDQGCKRNGKIVSVIISDAIKEDIKRNGTSGYKMDLVNSLSSADIPSKVLPTVNHNPFLEQHMILKLDKYGIEAQLYWDNCDIEQLREEQQLILTKGIKSWREDNSGSAYIRQVLKSKGDCVYEARYIFSKKNSEFKTEPIENILESFNFEYEQRIN